MTVTKYFVGFILSLLLTGAAYGLVVYAPEYEWLLLSIGVLAVVQMIVQLVFFLHLGEESKPRQKTISFLLMMFMLLILVVGSIWIMANMDYNMMHMSPQEKENYMKTQYDKGF